MRPFWLMLIALEMVQPEGTVVLRTRIPVEALQTHAPPYSLVPITTPESFIALAPELLNPTEIGGINVTPDWVPINPNPPLVEIAVAFPTVTPKSFIPVAFVIYVGPG